MKCPKEKELILFYYRELKKRRYKSIEVHLRECSHCLKRYENIGSFFAQLASKPIQLTSQELESMLQHVKQTTYKPSFLINAKDRLEDFLESIRLGLFYKPQLISVTVALIVILIILPLVGKRHHLNREFDIIQIEMELSLDSIEGTIFDLYEEELVLMDETSSLEPPTLHSKIETVRRET